MPRHQEGLKRGQVIRGGRQKKSNQDEAYAAGWLVISDRPEEDLLRLGGSVHSEMYVGAQSRNIFKTIKRTGEWFRFAFVEQA